MVRRKSLLVALGMAVSMMFTPGAASASPVASSLANNAIAGIASNPNQALEVRHRGRRFHHRRGRGHRGRRGFRRGGSFYYGAPIIGFGLGYGAPYYYDSYPYRTRPRYRRSYRGSGSCRRAHRACVARWGYGGGNYDGCMRYENCRPR